METQEQTERPAFYTTVDAGQILNRAWPTVNEMIKALGIGRKVGGVWILTEDDLTQLKAEVARREARMTDHTERQGKPLHRHDGGDAVIQKRLAATGGKRRNRRKYDFADTERVAKIVAMRDGGATFTAIGEELGISRARAGQLYYREKERQAEEGASASNAHTASGRGAEEIRQASKKERGEIAKKIVHMVAAGKSYREIAHELGEKVGWVRARYRDGMRLGEEGKG